MSRQFGFYATPTDLIKIVQMIEDLAVPFAILETRKKRETPVIAADLASVSSLACAVARREELADLRWSALRTGEEMLNVTTSPVIEILRPYFDGHEMSRGRFYYTTEYYDESRRLVSKSLDFLDWASAAFRVVKKGLACDKNLTPYAGDYVGPEARKWIDESANFTVNATGRIMRSGVVRPR
jgi:hypothetical protein